MATAIPSYTTASRHCQQLADSLADFPAPSPGPSSTVREWSPGHIPPPGKPKRWGRPLGINGLRARCSHRVHHAAVYRREGFARAVAGQQLILRAIRRYTRSFCATAPPSRGSGQRPPALPSPAVDPRGELSE